MTVAAIVAGAASVTFGIGLAASLNRAYTDISQAGALPVEVSAIPQAPAVAASRQGAAASPR